MQTAKPWYKSRKNIILIVDTFAAILALLVGRFMTPEDAKLILAVWGAMQPAIIMVIWGIVSEDNSRRLNSPYPFPQEKDEDNTPAG